MKDLNLKKIIGLLVPFIPLVIALLAFFETKQELAKTTATLVAERKSWDKESKESKLRVEKAEKQNLEIQKNTMATFTSLQTTQEPIIVRSTDTVREYEKTDAGRTLCLDADGVRRFTSSRDSLFGTFTQNSLSAGESKGSVLTP